MVTTLQEAARKALKALEVAATPLAKDRQEVLTAMYDLRTALAQQELPQKERPDFMAGYDAGMADAKRMAQQGATKNCPQPEICGSKECEFCRDTVAPKVKGDGS